MRDGAIRVARVDGSTDMTNHEIVGEAEWIEARKALLAREKAFTRERDALATARRALPWRLVETDYVFDGSDGRESLADLFGGKSQLIVYHFMFGPDWEQGCKACSYLSDYLDGAIPHLAQRDVRWSWSLAARWRSSRRFGRDGLALQMGLQRRY